MRLLFAFPSSSDVSINAARSFPSGGTERSVAFVADALESLGHEVTIWWDKGKQPDWSGFDVIVTQHAQYFANVPDETARVWWLHHFCDQPIVTEHGGFARAFADAVVCLSETSRANVRRVLKMEPSIIPHGVDLARVSKLDTIPGRLLYCSAPFRGLEQVLEDYPLIKAAHPHASLVVAGTMRMYGQDEQDRQFKPLYDALAALPDVHLLGPLNQAQLFDEMAKAEVFYYPCKWPESYCMALDEAIAHGCIPITTGLAALGERVKTGYNPVSDCIDALSHGMRSDWAMRQPLDWADIGRMWNALICHTVDDRQGRGKDLAALPSCCSAVC